MRVRGAMRRAGARAMGGLSLELEEAVGHRDFSVGIRNNKELQG
jgi:hypothetical protein